MVASTVTSSNGKYSLTGNVPKDESCEIVYSKPGMVTKKISVDASKVHEEDMPAGNEIPLPTLDLDLFAERPNVDFSFLDTEYVAEFSYNERQFAMTPNLSKAGQVKKKISDLLLQAEKNKAEVEAKYAAAIQAADAAYDKEEYQEALDKYEEALGYKPQEPHPAQRIVELDALLQAQKEKELEQQQADSEYNNLIEAANNLRDQKQYEQAIEKYEEALDMKDEQYPKDQIRDIKALVKEQESQAAYDEAMKLGGMFLKQKSLRAARDKFEEASKLKPSEPLPKQKIEEIDKLLNAAKEEEERKANYDAAILAADALFDQEDYAGAKAKYEEALTFESASSYAKGRVEVCNEKLAAAEAEKLKQEKIKELLAAGNTALDNKSYNDAKGSFNEVLTLDAENAEAKEKLVLIEQKIKEEGELAAKQEEFNKLVTEGDQANTANNLTEAVSKYEAAIALIPSEEVNQKIADVKAKIADQEALAQKKEQFDKLVEEGNQLMSDEKLVEAKAKFEEAGKLDPSSTVPPAKITEIDGLLANQQEAADRQAKYDAAINEANALFDQQKWPEAQAKYREALPFTDDKSYAEGRITEIDGFLADEKAAADRQAKYDAAINDANALFDQQKWPEAQAKYREALAFTDDKTYAEGRITEIDGLLANQQAAADRQAKYDAAINEANNLFDSQKWPEAQAKYREALTFTDDPSYAQGRITEIDGLLANQQAAADRQANYDAAINEANRLFDQQSWPEAQSKYREALAFADDKTYAEGRIKEIDDLIAKQQSDQAAQDKINNLLSDAKSLFDNQQLNEARDKYQEVLTLDAGNQESKSQIELINTQLAAQKSEQEREEAFKKLKKEGFDLADNQKYAEAKLKLNEALAIQDDADIRSKLTEIDEAEKALNDQAALDNQYNQLITEAKTAEGGSDYSLAIEKYKAALDVKPGEKLPKQKIKELEGKLEDQKKIDEEYQAIMDKGDELMKEEKYLEAIKEYNAALKVKPNEKEPVEKAALAEQAEKDRNTAGNAQYEKILTVAQKKIDEGDYKKAIELANRAKALKPSDPRPQQLIDKVELLKKQEADYTRLMKEGDDLAKGKKYQDAKSKFEEASKKKPNEELPKKRIDDMQAELDKLASSGQKDKLYKEYMEKGAKSQRKREFNTALSSYKDALGIKPGDVDAQAKIDEVQQILDDLANAADKNRQKQNKFNKVVAEANEFFQMESYIKAKEKYEEALAILPGDAYASTQRDECIRLSIKQREEEEEREYKKIITAADKRFDQEDWEKAKDYYKRALMFRSTDPYPKKRLNEIEGILNPASVNSAQLEDLGDPYDGSLIDGQALLEKAEKQRKQLKVQKVTNELDNIHDRESQLSSQKTDEHRSNSNEIYQIQQGISRDLGNRDLGRQKVVDAIRAAEDELSTTREENSQYEHADNISSQGVIYGINEEVALNYGERDEVYMDNTDVMYDYKTNLANAAVEKATADQLSSVESDQTLIDIKSDVRNEVIDDYASREKVRAEVFEAKGVVSEKHGEKSVTKYGRVTDAQRELDIIEQGYSDRHGEGMKKAHDNSEDLVAVQKKVSETSAIRSGIEGDDHYQADALITEIEKKVDKRTEEGVKATFDNSQDLEAMKTVVKNRQDQQNKDEQQHLYLMDSELTAKKEYARSERAVMDDGRKNTVEVLKAGNKELAEARIAKEEQHKGKQVTNKGAIEQEKINTGEVEELAKVSHAKKVDYVNRMDKKAQINSAESTQSDLDERLSTASGIHDVYSDVSSESGQKTEKQEQNQTALDDSKKVVNSQGAIRSNDEKKSIYKTADKISKVDDAPAKKPKIKNALGEEYPEGVSQEQFTQSDQNGLMTSIITRRIVVIDGQADVYVRTQTSTGTTYTKNGKPSLQHVWNKETQSPKLERHF